MPRVRFLPETETLTLAPVQSLSFDPASGAVMAHVPLPLPSLPESFGMEKLLSIEWVNGLQDGPLGPGWNLSFGRIAPTETRALTPVGTQTLRAEFPGGGGELLHAGDGWSISHGAEITADLLKGNALDADDWSTHLKWAGTFAFFTAVSAGTGYLAKGVAESARWVIGLWYYGLSTALKWLPKTRTIGEKLYGLLRNSVRCGAAAGAAPGCP